MNTILHDHRQLVAWLNDAYAMEHGLLRVLEEHARKAVEYPDVRERDKIHRKETEEHARRLERCLDILGEKPSALKAALGSALGKIEGTADSRFRDEIVKNFLSDYAAEHFEIAAYTSLIAAADALGQPEISKLCRGILDDEIRMARWLVERIGDITRATLRQQAMA